MMAILSRVKWPAIIRDHRDEGYSLLVHEPHCSETYASLFSLNSVQQTVLHTTEKLGATSLGGTC